MRRAMKWLALALGAAALLPVGLEADAVKQVNGIGLIDYRRKPDFKVGDWVKYRITGENQMGAKDDYLVTILIAAQENFWGEEGFWVETWTELAYGPPMGAATLMSYSIFDDSLPDARMELYQRKTINESDPNGNPIQVVLRRSPGSLRLRKPYDDKLRVNIDTLGRDTASVALGTFQVVKVRVEQGKGVTREFGDSTEYTELWDNRVDYISRQIPLTSLVREDIETLFKQRKWRAGRSEDAPPLHTIDRSVGEARLVDFGTGMKSRMLPEYLQKSFRRGRAEEAAPPKRPPPPRGTGGKSG